jgi:uncharacterized membrane protein YqiK
METPDILGTAGAGAGGVITMGAIAKWLIQNWIKKHDDRAEKQAEAHRGLADVMAQSLEAIRVELGKISVRLEMLQETSSAMVEIGKTVAVMEVRIADFGKCLNGLGQKVRNLNGGA